MPTLHRAAPLDRGGGSPAFPQVRARSSPGAARIGVTRPDGSRRTISSPLSAADRCWRRLAAAMVRFGQAMLALLTRLALLPGYFLCAVLAGWAQPQTGNGSLETISHTPACEPVAPGGKRLFALQLERRSGTIWTAARDTALVTHGAGKDTGSPRWAFLA